MSDEVDIDSIIDDLHDLRGQFGRVETGGDDYRQAKIDVAIEQIMMAREVREDFKSAGMWPDDED